MGIEGTSVPDTALAYIAGILDGEGYITIKTYKTGNGNQSYGNVVRISNTNEEVIDYINFMLGGNKHSYQYRPDRKVMYTVDWTGSSAAEFKIATSISYYKET